MRPSFLLLVFLVLIAQFADPLNLPKQEGLAILFLSAEAFRSRHRWECWLR